MDMFIRYYDAYKQKGKGHTLTLIALFSNNTPMNEKEKQESLNKVWP